MGEHIPVLLEESIRGLNIQPEGVYVDATLGRGGHSKEILRRLSGKGRLIAIDRDTQAIEEARENLEPWINRVTFVHRNFDELRSILKELNIDEVDGLLFDLGVSSPQIDEPSRGFSYQHEAPLDMRMDQSSSLTAAGIVNSWPASQLRKVLYEYGEERFAPQISAAIVRAREKKPIETTTELAEIVRDAMPGHGRKEKQHPARRTFQALRIAVNDELGSISKAMEDAIGLLRPGGGRLCVITFHSLEDRIVKTAMANAAKGCICPPDIPVCVCGHKPEVRILTKKPIEPGEMELRDNPRSHSAKLRICERLSPEEREA